MDQNIQRLTTISKLFTAESLKNILESVSGKRNVSLTGWSFGDASAKGDGYLSTVDRITIKGLVDGKSMTIRVIAKSLPQNLGRRKTNRSTDFFYNEIQFYSKIVPVFQKFLKSKNSSHLLRVPECLRYVLDGDNDFIVLRDMSVDGFGPVSRQSTVSLEECKVILTGMARFHAISFAYKDQCECEFSTVANQLIETYCSEKYWNWYKRLYTRLVSIAKHAVVEEYGKSTDIRKFTEIDARTLIKMAYSVCDDKKDPTAVINQGDSWAPNFLVRTIDSTGEKEALLLDFQFARCASPVTDLSFFIYSCTDKILRDNDFDNLLAFYHRELSNTISSLGSDPAKVYSWEKFIHEVQERFVHGFIFSLESIPFSMLDDDESFDLDSIEGDEAIDLADLFTLKPIVDQAKRRRLADVVMHAIQRGFLK